MPPLYYLAIGILQYIRFIVHAYTQTKSADFCSCLYLVSKVNWTVPNYPNISTKAHARREHFDFSLDSFSFYKSVQFL